MAYFYMGRVFHLQKIDDPTVRLVGTEASLKYVDEEYNLIDDNGNTTRVVRFPRKKYLGVKMETHYANGDRDADPPVLPTVAMIRTEQPLESGDYNVDLQTKGAAYWANLYATYPMLAATPFLDAPYQP